MNNVRYSPSELADIIGTTRKKSQLQWLASRNWRFDIDVNGRPVVLREYVASKLGAVTKSSLSNTDNAAHQRPRFELLAA